MYRPSLNHTYRLVWSDITQAYVAVAEHTKSHGKRKALSVAIAIALTPALSLAQPVSPPEPPIIVYTNENHTVNATLNLNAPGAVYTIAAGEGIFTSYTETFTNIGEINVKDMNYESARRDVFGVVTPNVSGTILNSGIISANITTSGAFVDLGDSAGYQTGSAFATAVEVGSLSGAFTNAGSITAFVENNALQGTAQAIGVAVKGGIEANGTFSNAVIETISASALSTSGADALAYGIYIQDGVNGTLTNHGTISADAFATHYTANAAGISIHDDIALTGKLINNGSIKVDAASGGSYSAEAHGVQIYGDMDGTLINASGASITATAQGYQAGAAGFAVYGSDYNDLNFAAATAADSAPARGAIINNGSINVKGEGVQFGQAAGIAILGDVAANIANGGTINAFASASGALVSQYETDEWHPGIGMAAGIQVVNGSLQGNIVNSGTIKATSVAVDGGEGYATGIWIGSMEGDAYVQGNITNSKVINASATMDAGNTLSGSLTETDGAEGYATGILVNGGVYGNILNSDTITATVKMTGANSGTIFNDGPDGAEGYATGIWSTGHIVGNIDNHKTIKASVEIADGAQGYANGVRVNGYLDGSFNNAGTITAIASGNLPTLSEGMNGAPDGALIAFAEGASFSAASGTISNQGTIKAEASGFIAGAIGMQTSAGLFGITALESSGSGGAPTTIMSNSSTGKIQATATGFQAVAGGMYVGSVYSGQKVVNDGSITATATSAIDAGGTFVGGMASSVGISIGELGGLLENSGTVGAFSVSADGGEGTSATGIGIQYMSGTINNSGTIIASYAADGAEGNSITIYSGEGGGTINNKASGRLIGGIDIQAPSVTLNNDGQLILKNGVSLNNVNNTGAATYGYVAGNYNQSATGVLHIAAESNQEGGYSQLEVGGSAAIRGKAFVDVKKANTLAVGQILENVVSAGSLSGDFISVADNSALMGFQSRVDGNTIDLVTIKDKTVVESVTNRGNTPGTGAATVVDRLIDYDKGSAALQNIVSELAKLSTEEEVSDAVSKLLPLLTSGTGQSINGAVNGASRIVQARQEGQVGRSSGDGFFGDKKVWFKPFGSWADQDERNNVAGYDSDTYGMVFGVDSELSTSNRVGLAFAYSKSDVDGKGIARQSADVDSYQLIGYASHSLTDATDLNFQGGLGMHVNKGHRDLAIGALTGTATSKYDSWSAHLGAGIAHTMKLSEATSFTPSARVDYTMIRSETYDETGRGDLAAITLADVDSRDTEALVVGVDGKVVHAINDRASLTANLGVGYDLLNERASTTAAFAGARDIAFTTRGIDPSPWLTRGGLGVVGKITDTLEVTARYDVEVREDFNNQTVSVKARWSF